MKERRKPKNEILVKETRKERRLFMSPTKYVQNL